MRGSVTKKKNRWYIYFYVGKDNNGKWKKKWEGSWETKREAERALRTRLTELETAAEQPTGAYTVETFLYYWLENYCVPRLKPNTIKGYTTNIEKHTLPTIGAIPLEKLEPKDLQNLYNVLRSKNLSDTSIRYVHNNLHKALDFAVKMQFIAKNPADYAVPPVIKHKEFQPLTPNEVTHLLKACVQKEVLLPVILATTLGLRRGEALGLQWKDVDFQTGTLTIRNSARFDKGEIYLETPKTKKSRRTLMIPQATLDALRFEKNRQHLMKQELGPNFNSLDLVCCRFDGRPFSTNALQHQFQTILIDNSLPMIRFHDLRHTNATLMLRSAVPAKIVSSMLGHSNISVTLDTYSHVITEMQAPAIAAMNSILQVAG